jgi:hypothetical protein
MSINTILLLLLALIVAAGIAFYQYLNKANYKSKLYLFLAFLRFSAVFLILILLINPIISRKKYEIQKTPLPIIVDNSESIAFFNQDKNVLEISKKIQSNAKLKEKYQIQLFSFDEDMSSNDSLTFKGKQSNIYKVFENLKQLYRSQTFPVIMLTDGNQTQGSDYVYNVQQNATVFPVILGDTIQYLDYRISQINANKYAFYKNKFPVEVFVNYSGNKATNANLTIFKGNSPIYKQSITMSANKTSEIINVFLEADKVGIHNYKAVISSSEVEKNKINNEKNFAVEVIDQRTEIAIIYSINHPDLGVLKRAIESNLNRKVTLAKVKEINDLTKYNILLLYQPDSSFKSLFDINKKLNLNTFTITGLSTDFNFLNQYQNHFEFKMSSQKEDYSAEFNLEFNAFAFENFGFEQFPPLHHPFGTITSIQNSNTLLHSRIRSIVTENPLLTFTDNGQQRNAYLFGENIWKWRMESYLKEKNFDKFDIFIDKTIQFLALNSKNKNLVVNHENFYNSGETVTISAQYFNKNYEFDENAQLSIQLQNLKNKTSKTYDFAKGNNEYNVSFDDLESGNYTFIVKEKSSNASHIGRFQILFFAAEKQFVNADKNRLEQLAQNTEGEAFFPSKIDELIKLLENSQTYKPIQKEVVTKSPLIDWIWGLVLLATLLTCEWITRKYHGML